MVMFQIGDLNDLVYSIGAFPCPMMCSMPRLVPEPYRIKMVEPIRMTDRACHRKAIAESGDNTLFDFGHQLF